MSDGIRKRPGRKTLTLQIAVPADLFDETNGPGGKPIRISRVLGTNKKPIKIVETLLGTADPKEA